MTYKTFTLTTTVKIVQVGDGFFVDQSREEGGFYRHGPVPDRATAQRLGEEIGIAWKRMVASVMERRLALNQHGDGK